MKFCIITAALKYERLFFTIFSIRVLKNKEVTRFKYVYLRAVSNTVVQFITTIND
jgi:hypothetical protein